MKDAKVLANLSNKADKSPVTWRPPFPLRKLAALTANGPHGPWILKNWKWMDMDSKTVLFHGGLVRGLCFGVPDARPSYCRRPGSRSDRRCGPQRGVVVGGGVLLLFGVDSGYILHFTSNSKYGANSRMYILQLGLTRIMCWCC